MVDNRGNAVAYVGGDTHRPIPLATDHVYRDAHKPTAPKRGGFDWDWNKTACTNCSTKTSKPLLVDGLCPSCRGVTTQAPAPAPAGSATQGAEVYIELPEEQLEERFEAPTRPAPTTDPSPEPTLPARDGTRLGRSLAELVATDPDVAKSAARLDDMVARVTRPDDHVRPAALEVKLDPTAENLAKLQAVLEHLAAQTSVAIDYVTSIRLHTQTPAASTTPRSSTPRATPSQPSPLGLGGRPAADREGEARRRLARRKHNGPARIVLPGEQIAAAYRAGQSLAQIAAEHNVSSPTIARCLEELGVPRRGAPVKQTPELVDQVRRLYVDEGLTKVEVAERIGHTAKVVENVMATHGIPSRPARARTPIDHAVGLKQRIAELGITSRDIKTWALGQGLVDHIAVGLPSRRLVDAYEAAHPTTSGPTGQSGDTPA